MRVTGGLSFTAISVGPQHTCGLTRDGTAYCWGKNSVGQLGAGASELREMCKPGRGILKGPCRSTPIPVAGELTFATISVGWTHTCAVTHRGAAYCWGDNSGGQLGLGVLDGPESCEVGKAKVACSRSPSPVVGQLSFLDVSAGYRHTCGVTSDSTAYCWGGGANGTLGNGKITGSPAPIPVLGP